MKTAEEYHPIDCDLHDYLEIACMYHYWLRIELTDGACFDAKALTTCTTVEKEEFLVVEQSENQQKIRLDCLSAITALTPGATFSTVSFQRAYRG
ncbi:Rho-binding antiterminator [Citrobacter portucalensis]|uniref:Rho-binding antiterminator n=1 Tax=Citrobacter portucalensis TaxID=1639133 RepID=UPI002243B66D|nr:Rho-binding antiterminator [Citrobacter portucalensis]MBJ9514975.1 Rho-binding antiterminator [Citrobacter freundii]MCW8351986.1 Rho-binding antiterminator [Citrobacter portucalensis]MCX9043192.1 Rho-binding antiterminator [Citrobacter portucalensis]MCX9053010.1 Rho-binding antiterminator [Citrobacter portucalensis]MCX9057229.1 Rho-binding antiterminator [Citrobacter portucalensis]